MWQHNSNCLHGKGHVRGRAQRLAGTQHGHASTLVAFVYGTQPQEQAPSCGPPKPAQLLAPTPAAQVRTAHFLLSYLLHMYRYCGMTRLPHTRPITARGGNGKDKHVEPKRRLLCATIRVSCEGPFPGVRCLLCSQLCLEASWAVAGAHMHQATHATATGNR
jgi:hypothetical protein